MRDERTRQPSGAFGLSLFVVIANLIPIIGIAALGWTVAATLLFLWLDACFVAVMHLWAACRAAHAGRASLNVPIRMLGSYPLLLGVAATVLWTGYQAEVTSLLPGWPLDVWQWEFLFWLAVLCVTHWRERKSIHRRVGDGSFASAHILASVFCVIIAALAARQDPILAALLAMITRGLLDLWALRRHIVVRHA